MKTSLLITTISLSALAWAGCDKGTISAPPPRTATGGSAAGKTTPLSPRKTGVTTRTASGIEGKIVETMDAAGYTYLRLKTAKGEIWAAVRQAKVKVGDEVSVLGALAMKGFTSKTLERTFALIYFGTLGKPGAVAVTGAEHGKVPKKMRVAAAHAGRYRKKLDLKGIAKADRTIAELFAQRKALAGKKVAIRGQVTKVKRVMGRFWVHLQDGSGTVADKSYDLTVTTQALVKVGDVVVFEGTLAHNKDFGGGYAYPALLEKATLKK